MKLPNGYGSVYKLSGKRRCSLSGNHYRALAEERRPHDCRHTCVSLLTQAGVDERLIKKIVGQKGQGVTQQVYTHFEIKALLDAINKI